MLKKDPRRLTYVVNKSLQYKFLAFVLIYSFLIVLFLAIALFVPDIIQMHDQSLNIEIQAAAADRILTRHTRIWPSVIVLICIIALHSFRTFYRVLGPLYRFHRTFEQVRDGDLSFTVRIRERDYLHREEETLREMIKSLAEKVSGIKQAGEDALRSLGELETTVSERVNWSQSDREALGSHRRHIENLMEGLRYFRLPNPEQKEANSGRND